MITEDYVSFETAKLLKERGFSGNVFAYYNIWDKRVWSASEHVHSEAPHLDIPAPTLQMAMKWLREVHHIFIDVDYDPNAFNDGPYFTLITNMDIWDYYKGKDLPCNNATYEDAAEAAIKYCLENLI